MTYIAASHVNYRYGLDVNTFTAPVANTGSYMIFDGSVDGWLETSGTWYATDFLSFRS